MPPDDPEAVKSRADLRLINALMGNHRWLLSVLRRHGRLAPGSRVIELGAGDGTFARHLLRLAPGITCHAIDLAPPPPDLPASCIWHQADLFDALPGLGTPEPGDSVIANLFLHHFSDDDLHRLGERLAECPFLAFSEPRRCAHAHVLGHALNLLGINRVTRHDLHASIDAGFRANELALALRLDETALSPRWQDTLLGAHRLVATLPEPLRQTTWKSPPQGIGPR